jgi:hypothetical protein
MAYEAMFATDRLKLCIATADFSKSQVMRDLYKKGVGRSKARQLEQGRIRDNWAVFVEAKTYMPPQVYSMRVVIIHCS